MNEENPLQICPVSSPASNGKDCNKRGRPTMKNIKKFGPQPKSIIAQLLTDMKTKNLVEDKPTSQNDVANVTIEFVEANLSDDIDCDSCLYRSNSVKEKQKQFLCDYPNCRYSCKLSSNLIKHRRVHTNEKPYLCDRCSFRTNFVNSLKAHKRIHTAEKPYHCNNCSYKCNSSSNLKKHCLLRHPERNN